ncbi:MAG TPA: DUF2948 family protein [Stellaceae bacterium]|nr:DUF2948 family protein [Stellaceae bacterium]
MTHPLRLKATDAEDLAVISACLQDALVLVGDMTYQAEERRFVMVANRFQWEVPPDEAGQFARITTGVSFEGVTAVNRRKIDLSHGEAILSLLAIQPGAGGLQLEFSEGGAIRLEVAAILCHLEDVGEAWPTRWRPRHPIDETP